MIIETKMQKNRFLKSCLTGEDYWSSEWEFVILWEVEHVEVSYGLEIGRWRDKWQKPIDSCRLDL